MAWLGLSDEEIDAMECLKANVGSASTHLTLRSYVSMTGADPSVHVWLKNQYFSDNKDFNIADLLMCANFVREGRKQTAHAADWHMSLSKYNPLLWENMNYFARLLEPEITNAWDSRLYQQIDGQGPCKNVTLATDTTLCVSERPGLDAMALLHCAAPAKYGKGVYGRKFEVSVVKSTGLIARVSPGVPASYSDQSILTHYGLLDDMEEWERTIADKIYTGISPRVICPIKGKNLTRAQKQFNYAVTSPRAIVENTNGHLKRYEILYHKWPASSTFDKQTTCFNFVCALVNAYLLHHPIRTQARMLRDRWEV